MRKLLEWPGIALGGLTVLLRATAGIAFAWAKSLFNRTYNIQNERLVTPSDEVAIARERRLEDAILDCTLCHGEDLIDGAFIDQPGLFIIHAPNLTTGAGGAGASFTNEGWVRAVRHDVGQDGKALMPAAIFSYLSAEDLAAVIAYVKRFPPVDNQVPEPELSLIAGAFILMGRLPAEYIIPARFISHDTPGTRTLTPSSSAAYGQNLVSNGYCTYGHRKDLSGGACPFPNPDAQLEGCRPVSIGTFRNRVTD